MASQVSRLLLLILSTLHATCALHIELNGHSRKCFYEYIRQKRTAYLRVGVTRSQDDLGIRLLAYGPFAHEPSEADVKMNFFDDMVYSQKDEETSNLHHRGFNFDTEHRGGWYKFCLDNTHSKYDRKTVEFVTQYSFTVDGEAGDEDEWETYLRKDHAEKALKSLENIGTLVDKIQNEQNFYKDKEPYHLQTLESSNSRLIYYTCTEIALLGFIYGLQAFLIHKWFNDRGFIIRQYA